MCSVIFASAASFPFSWLPSFVSPPVFPHLLIFHLSPSYASFCPFRFFLSNFDLRLLLYGYHLPSFNLLFHFPTVFSFLLLFFSSSHPIFCACFHPYFLSSLLVLLFYFLLPLCFLYLLIFFLSITIHVVACSWCEVSVPSRQAAKACDRLYHLSLTGSSVLDCCGS